MSFLERTLFRLTNDPVSDAAWKQQQAEKKEACEKERDAGASGAGAKSRQQRGHRCGRLGPQNSKFIF